MHSIEKESNRKELLAPRTARGNAKVFFLFLNLWPAEEKRRDFTTRHDSDLAGCLIQFLGKMFLPDFVFTYYLPSYYTRFHFRMYVCMYV